jgi:hypothetical protein
MLGLLRWGLPGKLVCFSAATQFLVAHPSSLKLVRKNLKVQRYEQSQEVIENKGQDFSKPTDL